MAQESPYLSVVAVSRNDEHGGNTLERTQIFVDSFLDQCERHQLSAELIIVEWNPPGEKAALAEVISWAKANQWVDCRVVTVPTELHRLLDYSRVLPLFQMIGKNVGIRRARGEFVLATNIDIMLSEEVFGLLASRKLRKDRMYRCDRFDVDSAIKNGSLDEKLNSRGKRSFGETFGRRQQRSQRCSRRRLRRRNISRLLRKRSSSIESRRPVSRCWWPRMTFLWR